MDITALVTSGYLRMISGGECTHVSPFIVDALIEAPSIRGSGVTADAGPVISGASTQAPSITSSGETPTTEPTAPTIIGGKVEKPSIRKK